MDVPLNVFFFDLVTPRHNQSMQFLNVILGLVIASLTIFLTVHGDNMHLHPLVSFLSFYYCTFSAKWYV